MKEFTVSLDVLSRSKSLRALVNECGIEPSDGSHDRSDKHPRGQQWGITRLRIDSGATPQDTIDAHLTSLITIMPDLSKIEDVELVLCIAMFFDTPMASVEIPMEILDETQLLRCKLQVLAYPSDSQRNNEDSSFED